MPIRKSHGICVSACEKAIGGGRSIFGRVQRCPAEGALLRVCMVVEPFDAHTIRPLFDCLCAMQEMVRVVLQSLECRGDPEAAGAASQPPEADSLHAHGLMAAVHIGCPARHDGAHAAIAAAASEEGQPAADACGSSESAPHPGAHCRLRTPLPCAAAPAGQADHGGNTLTADGARPLSWDSCQQIIALAAYPISAWL